MTPTMDIADLVENRSIARFRRFEWLLGQVAQAAREADAHARLDAALRRIAGAATARHAPWPT